MAACKFTPVTNPPPDFTIKQSDLPVTCRIGNPESGATIDLALFKDSTGKVFTLATSGQIFQIPANVAKGRGTLEVRTDGAPPPPVNIIEVCDGSELIMTIFDENTMSSSAVVEVL